jgi:hypothetical protein
MLQERIKIVEKMKKITTFKNNPSLVHKIVSMRVNLKKKAPW